YGGIERSPIVGLRCSRATNAIRATCHASSRPAYGGIAKTCKRIRAAAATASSTNNIRVRIDRSYRRQKAESRNESGHFCFLLSDFCFTTRVPSSIELQRVSVGSILRDINLKIAPG